MFETRTMPEMRWLLILKRVCIVLAVFYLAIGMIALYRAITQIHSVEIQADAVVRSGSAVSATVVSYARTPIDVRIELVQDEHSEIVAGQRVQKNEWALLDPRTREATQTAVLTDDLLKRFAGGKAILRATATGRLQFGRLPPPVVREQTVDIQRN
jgi:hypothetical protein